MVAEGNVNVKNLVQTIRGGSRTAATSKMEHFVIIVNDWKPLTIITKSSMLDVAAVLDPPLTIVQHLAFRETINSILKATNQGQLTYIVLIV